MKRLKAGEDAVNVSELVVDHESKKTHLGGTALVELNGTLLQLGLLIEGVPAEVKGAIAEVTRELGFSGNVLHDTKFKEANEGEDLQSTGNGDGSRRGPARSEVRELGSSVINVTREVDTGLVDQVSDNTKHANAAMLDLDISETIELLLVTVSDKAKGIEETEGSLGAKLVLEGLQGSGGTGLLGRSKGGSGGKEGGENGGLHLGMIICKRIEIVGVLGHFSSVLLLLKRIFEGQKYLRPQEDEVATCNT